MININDMHKLPSETESEYCTRVCNLKNIYGLSWKDIADFLNQELGYSYSPDKYRKGFSRQNNSIEEDMDSLKDYILEIKKEKLKLQEEKTQLNSLVRTLSREETLQEIAVDVVSRMSDKKELNIPKPIKSVSNKKGILVISDWHYGIDVNNYYNVYSPEIAKERIYKLLCETVTIIKKEDISEIYLLNLGDMISGIIHLPLRLNSRLDVISQTIQVSEILAEFISELTTICRINYGSVTDNHSRLDPNKKEALQPESFTRVIDWYLKSRLEDNPNITFIENKLGDDICSVDIFDFKVLAVHGDKDPQKKILTHLTNFTKEHYDLVLSAHRHHFYADENNETELYSNGSLMGTDDYANSLRLNNKPSQLFIVADKENITRYIYKIKLS